MVGNTHSVRFVLSLLIWLALINSGAVRADQVALVYPRIIEVFTTTDVAVTGATTAYRQPENQDLEIQIYQLDAIQRFETNLSRDLVADPEQYRQMALQAIQQLDESSREKMQRAAMGMVNAMQYGIERYPAIVFDGQAVVYGITDLPEALGHYATWQAGKWP